MIKNPGDKPRPDSESGERQLANFMGTGYDKGRSIPVQVAWMIVSTTVLPRWWMPNAIRIKILRMFGANIADGVLIRHGVKIHWPWKLTIGAHSWIGERAWLLNLEHITIGQNVCVSQDVLLCTGSHDRHSPSFEFDNAAITIEDGCWIATRATILRGTTIGRNSVIGATSLVTRNIPAGTLHTNNLIV